MAMGKVTAERAKKILSFFFAIPREAVAKTYHDTKARSSWKAYMTS